MFERRAKSLMSQLPPCSRGGTVRAPSAAILLLTSPLAFPQCAVGANGGAASGGTRSGSVAMIAASRAFQVSSNFLSGRQPMRPGWMRPAKLTPGTCREWVYRPDMSQIDFCASGKWSVRKPPPFFFEKKPLKPRSEEHTSELQSHSDLVCRLLLE